MPSQPVAQADFLSELNESDSLFALRSAHSENSVLVFNFGTPPKPLKTYIENFLDKRVVLTGKLNNFSFPADRAISFKFQVGTETYFIKTFVKSHLNHYYFDMSSKVQQLKRRREPRFLIPKKWKQSATIILNPAQQLRCSAVDISLSGIRFEIMAEQAVPHFVRDDIIALKFQIHKRAEMSATAIVRFILNRPNLPVIMGLELADTTEVQKSRIASLIEDITLFGSVTKK